MPSRFPMRDRPNLYQPLVDVLAASHEDEVVLTFKEIVAILGLRYLPESAVLHGSWWTSKRSGHVGLWTAIGWRAHLDHRNQRVIFTCDAGGAADETS